MLDTNKLIADYRRETWDSGRLKTGDDVATLPYGKRDLLYGCPTCRELYATEEEARECQAQGYDKARLEIGDLVIIPGKRCWDKPPEDYKHWSAVRVPADPTAQSHFDHDDHWYPYYVVTGIHPERDNAHRCLVTVCTLYNGWLDAGWNPANGEGHCAMFRPHLAKNKQLSDVGSSWWDEVEDIVLDAVRHPRLLEEARALAAVGITSELLL